MILEFLHAGRWTDNQADEADRRILQLLVANMPKERNTNFYVPFSERKVCFHFICRPKYLSLL